MDGSDEIQELILEADMSLQLMSFGKNLWFDLNRLAIFSQHLHRTMLNQTRESLMAPFLPLCCSRVGRIPLQPCQGCLLSSICAEWWEHVLEYSHHISNLLGNPRLLSSPVIEDPRMILQPLGEPTSLKATWQLMQIFYVDKQSLTWLPEHLVDWLADYDSLLTETETTVHSKLVGLQKRLVNW